MAAHLNELKTRQDGQASNPALDGSPEAIQGDKPFTGIDDGIAGHSFTIPLTRTALGNASAGSNLGLGLQISTRVRNKSHENLQSSSMPTRTHPEAAAGAATAAAAPVAARTGSGDGDVDISGAYTIELHGAAEKDDAAAVSLGLGPQITSRVSPMAKYDAGDGHPTGVLSSVPRTESKQTSDGTGVRSHGPGLGPLPGPHPDGKWGQPQPAQALGFDTGRGIRAEPTTGGAMDAWRQLSVFCLLVILVLVALRPAGEKNTGQRRAGWSIGSLHRQRSA